MSVERFSSSSFYENLSVCIYKVEYYGWFVSTINGFKLLAVAC